MDIEQRLQKIEERNKSVEADKAWETSWIRVILLALFTYIIAGVFIRQIGVPNPWLSSIVPAVGFLISTLSLPYFKKVWLKNRK